MDRVQTDHRTPRFLPQSFGLLLFLFLPLGLLLPGSAQGQSPAERVVGFLDSASGFHLLGTVHEGKLASGKALRITARLLEGADYMVVGFCDEGCSNLDLTLFDPFGREAGSDWLPDPEPILMFTAEETGAFHIQVDAVDCGSDPCELAVGILGSTSEAGAAPGEDMGSRLLLVGGEFRTLGFENTNQGRRGALGSEQAVPVPVTLERGLNYRIVGVCDHDCLDIDLRLFNPDGVEVDSDLLEDPLPILSHMADTTAEFSVEVAMVACMVEPCAFRVETFAQPRNQVASGKVFSGTLLFHETYEGVLTEDDEGLGDSYVEIFEVEAEAGNRVVVNLRSDEFDTFLRLVPPTGKGVQNDDFGTDTGHSFIDFLAVASGTYEIQVTSYTPFAEGSFLLEVAIVQ